MGMLLHHHLAKKPKPAKVEEKKVEKVEEKTESTRSGRKRLNYDTDRKDNGN